MLQTTGHLETDPQNCHDSPQEQFGDLRLDKRTKLDAKPHDKGDGT
jgi:hypothetical protein